MRIAVNFGHGLKNNGTYDPGAIGPTKYQEATQNEEVGKLVVRKLKANGHTVLDIHDGDLSDVTKKANDWNADYFISIHANASVNPASQGVETYALAPGGMGEKMAIDIQKELVERTDLANRGVKFANFHVLRETKMPAVLVEAGFISNPSEEALMKKPEFDEKVAEAICIGFSKALKIPYVSSRAIESKTPIVGKATATLAQAKAWAKSKNAPQFFIDMADIYWTLAPKVGINPVGAYVQSAHETGYWYKVKSSAGIDGSYNNPCGIKTTQGGGDYEANAHKKFTTITEGITAHLDHLALYAGVSGYPKANTPDPRHFPYLLGAVKTWEGLSGRWAPSATYGTKLVSMIKELESTVADIVPDEVLLLKAELKNANQAIREYEILIIGIRELIEKNK